MTKEKLLLNTAFITTVILGSINCDGSGSTDEDFNPCGDCGAVDQQASNSARAWVCKTLPANTICRPAVGAGDIQETCSVTSMDCPSDAKPLAGVPCNAIFTGACDEIDVCDGINSQCVADSVKPKGTPCRSAITVCDAPEICDGVSKECPVDIVQPAGYPCRLDVDSCDSPKACDGVSMECPEDVFREAGFTCRAVVTETDLPEVCDGTSAQCPDDVYSPLRKSEDCFV